MLSLALVSSILPDVECVSARIAMPTSGNIYAAPNTLTIEPPSPGSLSVFDAFALSTVGIQAVLDPAALPKVSVRLYLSARRALLTVDHSMTTL